MPQFDCRKSEPRNDRHREVSARPLYPVPIFADTAVVDRVARFGGYVFAQTDRGWQVIQHVEVPGSVEVED